MTAVRVVRTEQAPSAKPVATSLKLTTEWQTLVDTPVYDVPVVGFGSARRIAPGVSEPSSPILVTNVSESTVAKVDVRVIRSDRNLLSGLTEANFTGESGSFTGGAGWLVGQQIILTNDTAVLVGNVNPANGSVTEFTIQSTPDSPVTPETAIAQIAYPFSFNADKCFRDVGYIVEAVALDVVLGTNYNSVTAGLAYQRAGSALVIETQQPQTIAAWRYVENEILELGLDATSNATVTASIDEIIDIIENGNISTNDAADALFFNPLPDSSANAILASTTLQAEKSNISGDLIAWIDGEIAANSANPSSIWYEFTYDSTLCQRDSEFVVDALTHDVLYGGDYASVRVADAYFVGISSQLGATEVAPTIAAYEELSSIINTYISTVDEQTRVVELLDIVIDVLEDGNVSNLPEETFPDVTSVLDPTLTDYGTIISAKSAIQTSTIQFINSYFGNGASGFSISPGRNLLSESTNVLFLARNLQVEVDDVLIVPVNGQFFLSRDQLQIRSDQNDALHATLSFTEGQSEENDISI
jgi:hypothetical protein